MAFLDALHEIIKMGNGFVIPVGWVTKRGQQNASAVVHGHVICAGHMGHLETKVSFFLMHRHTFQLNVCGISGANCTI